MYHVMIAYSTIYMNELCSFNCGNERGPKRSSGVSYSYDDRTYLEDISS